MSAVFFLRRPSGNTIESFLDAKRGQEFSYPRVGATRTGPPPGYNVDHNQVQLGSGSETFAAAADVLRRWRMFDIGWLRLFPPTASIEPGVTVAVLARTFGLWSLHACRIVYVLDEAAPVRRCGFAYGTLREHAEEGEERFSVEWRQDDSVWYDILAFSRPRHWLARAGYPLSRRLQRRFVRDSMAAMVAAVRKPGRAAP